MAQAEVGGPRQFGKGHFVKKELRQALRQRIAAIPPEERHSRSMGACTRLFGTDEYRSAGTIMIYLSTPQEVDTGPIALQAWADGKRVAAPQISWEQRRMVPIEIQSLTSGLQDDAMGIRQPVVGPPTPIDDIDLVIVPGLGFDEKGNRLGRGRGFYDRFLAHRDLRAIACAMAFEDQLIEAVPEDENDMRVTMLITEKAIRRFQQKM